MAYKTIEARFWRDTDIRKLSKEAKLLLLFLITGPESHYTGLFWMPPYVPLHELEWSPETMRDAITELEGERNDRGIGMGMECLSSTEKSRKKHFFIKFCPESNIIWVKSMLRYQVGDKPLNTKQLKGVLNHIKQFRKSQIVADFLSYYKDFFKQTVCQKEFDMRLSVSIREVYQMYDSMFFLGKNDTPMHIQQQQQHTAAATEDKDSLSETKVSDGANLNSPSNKKRKPIITPEQVDALYKAFNGTEDKVRLFISTLAAENKTGALSISREASVLTELKSIKDEEGIDKFEYGLTEANTRGIPNINYLKKAMTSYGKQPKQEGGNYNW